MESNRRSFLYKISGLFSLAFFKGSNLLGNEKKAPMPQSKITSKPLGFQWETKDPFLFCVHHEDFYPKGNGKMGPNASLAGRPLGQDFMIKDGWRMYHGKEVPGFPEHPHRGFETITIVLKGMVDHSDSMGASGRYGDGDVQWMTSGRGLQHAEMFPLLKDDDKNTLELFQIWINLPRVSKFVEPHFKMMWNETIPKVTIKDDNGRLVNVSVIAGELDGDKAPTPPPNSWAANEDNGVLIYNATLNAHAEWRLPKIDLGVNLRIYFYQGSGLLVNDQGIEDYHAIDVEYADNIILKAGNEECKVLILQGRPINEPVVQHGPFVMNSREEIQQAFEDYQKTQFGGWPWSSSGPVHEKHEGRFAKHADGRIEKHS